MATRSFSPWKGHLTIPKRSQRIARTLFFCNCFVIILTGPARFFEKRLSVHACGTCLWTCWWRERGASCGWLRCFTLRCCRRTCLRILRSKQDTVDGRNPAPPTIYGTLWKWDILHINWLADSFHQQYLRCCKENDGAKFCSVLPKETPAPPKTHLRFQAKKIGWSF